MKINGWLLPALLFFCLISCTKEEFVTDSSSSLEFSTDTVFFDTIFSTVGSVTRQLRVYNPYDKDYKLSRIYLARDGVSDFRLNIDGQQTNSIHDKTIRANDSIFIFVEVTVDDGIEYNEERDSIIFESKHNVQDVKVLAWGRDVKRVSGGHITIDTIFTSERPYLIFSTLYVDEGVTLEIEPGTELYFYKDAGLYVNGCLIADGERYEPIIFNGQRTEELYEDIPGQWNGIYLANSSQNNKMDYVEVHNAVTGVQVGEPKRINDPPALELSNAIIANMTYAGIMSYGADIINAYNCLIANCGYYAIKILGGGNCDFYHTTIANYYAFRSRFEASVVFSNTLTYQSTDYSSDLNLNFYNSIIWGDSQEEVNIMSGSSNAQFNYLFDHLIIKINPTKIDTSDHTHFVNVILNEDPAFVNTEEMDFTLDTLSPAVDAGNTTYGSLYQFDLKENSRVDDVAPDLGAYERK